MPTAQIIYNPAAGRFPVTPAIPLAEKALQNEGWETSTAETNSGQHATALAAEAAEKGIAAVYAVGGDGTIGQIASGLMGTDTALAILPAGTSNVLGKELGLRPYTMIDRNSLQDNAQKLARAPRYAIDVGICNEQPFLMWAGLGLDALTIKKAEPQFRFEKFFTIPDYAASMIAAARNWRGVSLRIWADGKKIEGHYILAVVNNIRLYGGGLIKLSPNALLDDGIFDLWLYSGETMADALRLVYEMLSGKHITSPHAMRVPFRELRLEADTAFAIQTDGELRFVTKLAEISVKKRALQALLPSTAVEILSSAPLKGSFA